LATRYGLIPMDFASSPLWYNIYLLHYETQFIRRLAKLNCPDLMARFKFVYRYIDDLCLINNGMATSFLSPHQERVENNPI